MSEKNIEEKSGCRMMSVNDAIRKLSSDGAEFLMFRDTDKQKLMIVCMRDDGMCWLQEV